MRYVQTEWLKEKRSANRKLLWVTPPIFILFCLFASQLMAQPPEGKSYFITVAYNWYPVMILPIVLSLLSVNSMGREKPAHLRLFQAQNLSRIKINAAKQVVSWLDFALILFFSLGLLVVVEGLLLSGNVPWLSLALATTLLFLTNAFALPFNAWLLSYVGAVGVVLTNFALYILGAVVAVTPYWFLYPWCYGAVCMAPVLGIHPNGTFLPQDHPLNDIFLVPMGILVSVLACAVGLVLLLALQRKDAL